jgi:hypothetical protein
MKMTKMTIMVNRMMTSVLAPVIMYVRFNTALTRLTPFSVFLVPYHLCTWRHVRGDAAYRLV